jgi:4-hydroxy-tetrahydrodipicolinate reductase
MGKRVIVWGTGNVGLHALRSVIFHPEFELAGVIVHSESKNGRDAGELCGVEPTGVLATTDVEAALASDADAVCYTATGDLRPTEAIEDICRALAAGKHVVTTSLPAFIYPPAAPFTAQVEQLEQACRDAGRSCYVNGIDPGFANDLLPLTLLGACERVDTVRVMEILNYATYDQPQVLFDTMGFGQPLEHIPVLLSPGILSMVWGPVVHQIAAGLGVTLEEVRDLHEKASLDHPVEAAGRTVEPGTQAGLRFEVQGLIDGEPRIILEHVTRVHDDVAPQWPAQGDGGGRYRVEITGNPNMACDLYIRGEDGDHNTGGLLVTAVRVLNAVPAVCEADPPRLLSTLDLPLVTGKGGMRPG